MQIEIRARFKKSSQTNKRQLKNQNQFELLADFSEHFKHTEFLLGDLKKKWRWIVNSSQLMLIYAHQIIGDKNENFI